MKIMKIGWTVLLSGLLFSQITMAQERQWSDFTDPVKNLNNKQKNSSPNTIAGSADLENSQGEAGEICSPANQVPYQLLKKIANYDKIEFSLTKDKEDPAAEILEMDLPVTQHACLCPKLQAYKQDGKIFVVIENDFFKQNSDWLYQNKEKK